MKRHKYLSVVICISFLMVLFLFELARNVLGEVKEADTVQVKEFQWKTKAKFDELSKKIYELEEKAEKTDSKTRADVRKKMNELREIRAVIQINMEKLDVMMSKDQWETVRQSLESEMDELEKAYRKTRSLFESE